jgi:hypothetical protein
LEAGPQALALSLRPESGIRSALLRSSGDIEFEESGERFIARRETPTFGERVQFALELLDSLS